MHILGQIEEFLRSCSTRVPIELFTFAGSFVEEVVAPIPSPLVMTLAGSIAFAQGKTLIFLLWLALLGAVGKTLGAWLIYFVADKLEDVIVEKFGRFFGVSQSEVEAIGKRFSGGWKDGFALFLLRAVPVVPTSPVSVVCGVIKINLWTYIGSTFLGVLARNVMYLYLGYAGVSAYESLVKGLVRVESFVQIAVGVLIAVFLGWVYCKRRSKH